MNNKYEVIIVGAGIGGLTCGMYLAKAGVKTLIIEKNHNVGGYCTSFARSGYQFDSALHYIGSCRENGWVGKFIQDHNLRGIVDLRRADPSDVVLLGDKEIPFYSDINKTKKILKKYFPKEAANIDAFIKFIKCSSFVKLYAKLRKISFGNLLTKYFNDNNLKSIFSLLIGNMEVHPSHASGLAVAVLYREFIFDGGYYPMGGMQNFSDALLTKFQIYGGTVVLEKEVTGILVENNIASGVMIGRDKLPADVIVANCDAHHLFTKLIDAKEVNKEFSSKLNTLQQSCSSFIVYLGLKNKLDKYVNYKCSTWYAPNSNIDEIFRFFQKNQVDFKSGFVFCGYPSFHDNSLAPTGTDSVMCIVGAPYLNEEYWQKNRTKLEEVIIDRINQFIPGVRNMIEVKESATPITLFKYTRNYNGALSGWANIVGQVDAYTMPHNTFIKNLYMCGHWVTTGFGQGGIGMVVYSGQSTSKSILKRIRRR